MDKRPIENELDLAKAMAQGQVKPFTKIGGSYFVPMRITGTGLAFRYDESGEVKEIVNRDEGSYSTADFLERCNGLPVVLNHPDEPYIGDDDSSPLIGTVIYPYIKKDQAGGKETEVWGIARIFGGEIARKIKAEKLSTSPGVITAGRKELRSTTGLSIAQEEAGTIKLLDHLAVVPTGVWDKGEEPSGIRFDGKIVNNNIGGKMAKAKKDASTGQKEFLDSFQKKLQDAIGGVFENMHKEFAPESKDGEEVESKKEMEKTPEEKLDEGGNTGLNAAASFEPSAEKKGKEEASVKADAYDEEEKKDNEEEEEAKEKKDNDLVGAAATEIKKDAKGAKKDAARPVSDAKDKMIAEMQKRIEELERSTKAQHDSAATVLSYDEMQAVEGVKRSYQSCFDSIRYTMPDSFNVERAASYERRLIHNLARDMKEYKGIDFATLDAALFNDVKGTIKDKALKMAKDKALKGGMPQRIESFKDGVSRVSFSGAKKAFFDEVTLPPMRGKLVAPILVRQASN